MHPLALVFALVVAVAVALVVIGVAMDPPGGDLRNLAGLLSVSALVSLAAYLGLVWYLPRRPLTGARGRVVLVALFSGVLALVNVLITAAFMFLSSHDLTLLAALMLFALLVSSVLAIGVSHSISQPIVRLVQGVDQVRADHVAVRVDVEAPAADEIGRLAGAFNAMAARLETAAAERQRAETSRRELLAAISHDLRTPISNARLMTEAIADGLVDEEGERRYIKNIKAELDCLDRLIADLFELSRIEAGALPLQRAPTDLGVLVSESLETVRAEANQAGVLLDSDVEPGLPLANLDPLCMQRVLRNLLGNAVRYTPAGGKVLLSARLRGSSIELTVSDSGPGIPQEDAARIFEPFFRGDGARQREGVGAGLGLAIARGIVEAHGGSIALDRGTAQGSTFRTRLPLT